MSNLILEYVLANAAVMRGFAGYFAMLSEWRHAAVRAGGRAAGRKGVGLQARRR